MFCILLEYLIYAMTRAHKGLPIHDQFKSEQNQVTLGADCVLKLNIHLRILQKNLSVILKETCF